jgi:hypothetical protein
MGMSHTNACIEMRSFRSNEGSVEFEGNLCTMSFLFHVEKIFLKIK